MGERRGTKALELWCRRIVEGYPGVKIDNMTTSWRDGLAFCAMIHHFQPELIDFSKLRKGDIYHNNELAFRIAEKHLSIPALLEPEDMVEYDVPDRLSILTYLAQFYRVFASSPSRIVPKRPAAPSDRGIVSPASASPPTKMVNRSGGTPIKRDPCSKCKLPVFIAERLNVGRTLFHRTCFRCARCNSQLTLANFYETDSGEYCCETCPDEETASTQPATAEGSVALLRLLSDEEKSASLARKDEYSSVFESTLENTNDVDLRKDSTLTREFAAARSQFLIGQVISSYDDEEEEEPPPQLPKTKPPEIADGSCSVNKNVNSDIKDSSVKYVNKNVVSHGKVNEISDDNVVNRIVSTDQRSPASVVNTNITKDKCKVESTSDDKVKVKSTSVRDRMKLFEESKKSEDSPRKLQEDQVQFRRSSPPENRQIPSPRNTVNQWQKGGMYAKSSPPDSSEVAKPEETTPTRSIRVESQKDTKISSPDASKVVKLKEATPTRSIGKESRRDTKSSPPDASKFAKPKETTPTKSIGEENRRIDLRRNSPVSNYFLPIKVTKSTSLDGETRKVEFRKSSPPETKQLTSTKMSNLKSSSEENVPWSPTTTSTPKSNLNSLLQKQIRKKETQREERRPFSEIAVTQKDTIDSDVSAIKDKNVVVVEESSVEENDSKVDVVGGVVSRHRDVVNVSEELVEEDRRQVLGDGNMSSSRSGEGGEDAEMTGSSALKENSIETHAIELRNENVNEIAREDKPDKLMTEGFNKTSQISDSEAENAELLSNTTVEIKQVSPVIKNEIPPTIACEETELLNETPGEVIEIASDISAMETDNPPNIEVSVVETISTIEITDSNIDESRIQNDGGEIEGTKEIPQKKSSNNLLESQEIREDAIMINSVETDDYPEALNPFGDDGDESDKTPITESSMNKSAISLNPFGEDDDVEEEEKTAMKQLKPIPTARKGVNEEEAKSQSKPSIPVPATRRKITAKPIAIEGDTPEWMKAGIIRRISVGAEMSELNKVDGSKVERRVIRAPRISLNPFWSDSDENDEDRNGNPVPTPRKSRNGNEPKSLRAYGGSTSSLSSVSSGAQSTRKKKPAPRPPILTPGKQERQESELSSQTSTPSTSKQHSPKSTPKHRKTKRAPPPPTLDDSSRDDTVEWEKQKELKDELNRNRQSQSHSDTETGGSFNQYHPDKSTYGKWKRKKGPAPSRPIPQRRQIRPLPVVEIKKELDLIELQQQGLEKQGVRLEEIIREKCEGTGCDNQNETEPIDVDDLILQLFEVVNEKNELCRRQAELMYLRRQQRLEEEYADVEYQIRCLMMQPEANKTDSDKAKEEELIARLLQVVEKRNEIIECLEMDRQRENDEDLSITSSMNDYAAKRDDIQRDVDVELTEKKEKKKKKLKLKFHKKSNDLDKDIDESETNSTGSSAGKKKKFKLFK